MEDFKPPTISARDLSAIATNEKQCYLKRHSVGPKITVTVTALRIRDDEDQSESGNNFQASGGDFDTDIDLYQSARKTLLECHQGWNPNYVNYEGEKKRSILTENRTLVDSATSIMSVASSAGAKITRWIEDDDSRTFHFLLKSEYHVFVEFMKVYTENSQLVQLVSIIQAALRSQTTHILGLENQMNHSLWSSRDRQVTLELEKMQMEDKLIKRQLVSVVEERLKLLAADTDSSWKAREQASMRDIAFAYKRFEDGDGAASDLWTMDEKQASALERALVDLFPNSRGEEMVEFLEDLAEEATRARDAAFGKAHPEDVDIQVIEKKVAGTQLEKWAKALRKTMEMRKFGAYKTLQFCKNLWVSGSKPKRKITGTRQSFT